MNRDAFAANEWYHVYNRGVDKRRTFIDHRDFKRMQQLLYLANSDSVVHRSNYENIAHNDVFTLTRGNQLVSIAAYCLMPNHFHLLIREETEEGKTDGSISKFMRKLMTAYTMYFNVRYQRVGNLFYKPFRSKHISDDRYGQHLYNYILANPWELARKGTVRTQSQYIEEYPYSSLFDLLSPRSENTVIVAQDKLPFVLKPTSEILTDAHFFDIDTAR